MSKAFRFHQTGGPEVLRWEEVETGEPDPVSPRRLGYLGSIFLTHPSLPDYTATRAELLEMANDLFAMMQSGKIRIGISHAYPLREAPRVLRKFAARKTTGSIILVS